MMKIALQKKANLFRGKSQYALFKDEREIGKLIDSGNGDEVEIEIEGKSYRVERTRSGIATGALSGIRNLLNRKATGEFRLVDTTGAEVATARQPLLYQFTISAGPATLDVPKGSGQTLSKLRVMNERGDAMGEVFRGPWKITGRSDWFSSLPDTTAPILETFLLWLYVMCEQRMENANTTY